MDVLKKPPRLMIIQAAWRIKINKNNIFVENSFCFMVIYRKQKRGECKCQRYVRNAEGKILHTKENGLAALEYLQTGWWFKSRKRVRDAHTGF